MARQTHLSLSHSLLLQSVQTDPTPSGYYHLALSYAVPGGATAAVAQGSTRTTSNYTESSDPKYNLDQAIQCAGLAVEADPGDVKFWHLLGLLLAAQERWEEAREVLERGADLGVGEDDADVEISAESTEVGGLPSLGMRKGEGSDTVDSVQSDADVRTLLGPPISIRIPTPKGNSSTITPAIKTDGIGDISINRVSPTTSTNPLQPIYIFSQSQLQPSSSAMQSLPPTSTLLLTPPPSKYPPSQFDLFESHLQLRMTQGTVVEIVEGAEGAEALWLEVFGWVAKRRSAEDGLQRQSIDGITHRSSDHISSHHHTITTSIDDSPPHLLPNPNPNPVAHHHNQQPQQTSYPTDNTEIYQTQSSANGSSDLETNVVIQDLIPITISPATPTVAEELASSALEIGKDREKEKDQRKDQGKEKRTLNNAFRPKRLTSIDIERDSNNRLDVQKSKKNVGQMLKGSVMKSRAGITAATKKLGARHGGLRRSTSTPGSLVQVLYYFRGNFNFHFLLDFHVVFQQSTSYQASSIHSRRRLSFMSASRDRPLESPPPPPLSTTTQQPSSSTIPTSVVGHHHQDFKNERLMKDRLLSDLWLMSAATFRRLGKIDQAKGAIQEAEVKNENNPAVWVQVRLSQIFGYLLFC